MSNNDSIDEETKRILAEVEPDAQSGSNDSKESLPPSKEYIKKSSSYKNDDYNEYELSDNQELDDRDW